jgi:hypothetical protein
MHQQLIPVSAPERWSAALQGVPHAFGHTWANCYAMHLTTGLPTYLYVLKTHKAQVVCPIAERTLNGYVDIVTPYGFSGFTGTGSVDNLQEHWYRFAQDQGYVCGYIGLNPFMPVAEYVAGEKIYTHQTLFSLNLTCPAEEILAGMSARRRGQLNQYAAAVEHITTDKLAATEFFMANVHGFLVSRGASTVYQFAPQTLKYLLSLETVSVAAFAPGGTVQAVSIFAYTPYAAEYMFNVSVPAGKPYAAHLIWHGVQHLQQLGVPVLNLGGGIQNDDGVAEFKRRFGADTRPLLSLKQVYDAEKYQALCRLAGVDATGEGYFPPYRRQTSLLKAST